MQKAERGCIIPFRLIYPPGY